MPGTKRVINIGTNPDDGTGDLLRDALNKVNLNFDDVWQYTSVNSNLDITGDSINGTTDVIINPADTGAFKVTGDTIINPDGGNYNFTINGDLHNNVLYVQASTGRIGVHNTSPTVTLDITGDTKVSGMTTANNLTVTGNTTLGDSNTDTVTYNAKAATDFLPFSTTQNIGAPSNRWGYIYTTNLDVTGTIAGTFTGSMTSTLTGDVNNTNVTTVNANVTGPSNLTDVNISGNLVVQGTTTTLETTQVLVDNSIVFEGATDDAFETTLTITDPTADRTFTFPDATGTVATQEWVNAQSFGGSGPADTDALTEGTTNLYYTDTRADARITAAGSANWNTAYGWGDHSTAGYLTSFTETNDLSSAVTWANVPDTNITESSVTQHQAALSITESQISDLGTYLTTETFTEVSQDTTPQLGGNLDAQAFNITTTGKILYANVYNTTGDLPSASTYHGMFAHVHGTGKGYFAHAGNWVALANESDLSSYQTTAGLNAAIDSHLNQSNPTSGYVLSWNGTDYAWVANGSGGSSNAITQGDSAVTVTDTGTDGNVEFKTDNTVRWNINNSGHLLPEANATYDIGSATNKVRDLYLDANSLHIGSVDISESGGKLVMPAQELSGHLIPDTNATYDLGSAEYKIRHLFLSDNSIYIGDNTLRTSADGNLLLNNKMVNADTEYNNGAIIDVVGNGSDFFKREVTVNGVRIMGAGGVGGQTAVPDAWLEKVARMFELFTDPTGSGINTTNQRNLIKNLSGDTGTYHAGLPTMQRVARGAGADYSTNFLTDEGAIFWNLTGLYDTHVQNDMVWYLNSTGSGYGDGDNDAQEVIEHVFHTLHMHGLDAQTLKLYPSISSDWNTGPLYNAMVEAYDGGFWDPSGYGGANFKTVANDFEVAAKEYLYLLNFAMFDYSDLWDGASLSPEWADSVKTPAGVQSNLTLGYALYNSYIAPVISKPSLTTIRSIFQDGNTPAQDDPSQYGASGYVVDVFNGEFGSLAGKPATLAGYGITDALNKSSYETNDSAGAIDITKRHHFISGGVNYTLADGTYIGQELHFWRSAVGSGYSDITIANAKWTIPGDTTDARTNFVWRTNGANAADNRTFMAVWDGAGWCLSGGTVAA